MRAGRRRLESWAAGGQGVNSLGEHFQGREPKAIFQTPDRKDSTWQVAGREPAPSGSRPRLSVGLQDAARQTGEGSPWRQVFPPRPRP